MEALGLPPLNSLNISCSNFQVQNVSKSPERTHYFSSLELSSLKPRPFCYSSQFLPKVQENYPKDTDLIVACQKGLRSLAACELLYNAGYRNLFWVQGGLEAAEEEDLIIEGPQPLKFAGIVGVSYFTDQQRDAASREGWSYRLVFSARLVGIFLVDYALFFGAQQVGHYLQDLRSH
ncbi:hypothetical protein I3843_11G015600 [Carya illinoinensis]|nr:hypothetical protein I3843_11G015600 [Carya illinoinensis]